MPFQACRHQHLFDLDAFGLFAAVVFGGLVVVEVAEKPAQSSVESIGFAWD